MNNKPKLMTQILFYGSIWGILEATIGHILHFIPATIAGSIMFPIASFILYRAYKKTNSKFALVYIGLVAASIKSIDFMLPQISVFKTINPMMSIIVESMVVVLVITMLTNKKPVIKYGSLFIASISWRVVFVLWMVVQYNVTGNLAPYISTMNGVVDFIIISGVISAIIASALFYIYDKVHITLPIINIKPVYTSILLIVAIIVTYTL